MVTVNTPVAARWSYPVRSNESVSLVTNELLANINDLPEVVLIKMRICEKKIKKDKKGEKQAKDGQINVAINTDWGKPERVTH